LELNGKIKNYSISQKTIQSTLVGLHNLNNKYKIKGEKKLKFQPIFKGNQAADKEKNFSLIIISKNNVPDIKINLTVEFLFLIKEKEIK